MIKKKIKIVFYFESAECIYSNFESRLPVCRASRLKQEVDRTHSCFLLKFPKVSRSKGRKTPRGWFVFATGILRKTDDCRHVSLIFVFSLIKVTSWALNNTECEHRCNRVAAQLCQTTHSTTRWKWRLLNHLSSSSEREHVPINACYLITFIKSKYKNVTK